MPCVVQVSLLLRFERLFEGLNTTAMSQIYLFLCILHHHGIICSTAANSLKGIVQSPYLMGTDFDKCTIALYHLLTNGSFAVNGCRQSERTCCGL